MRWRYESRKGKTHYTRILHNFERWDHIVSQPQTNAADSNLIATKIGHKKNTHTHTLANPNSRSISEWKNVQFDIKLILDHIHTLIVFWIVLIIRIGTVCRISRMRISKSCSSTWHLCEFSTVAHGINHNQSINPYFSDTSFAIRLIRFQNAFNAFIKYKIEMYLNKSWSIN